MLRRLVRAAIAEDVGHGDITTHAIVPIDRKASAAITAKAGGILAGLPVAREVFRCLDRRMRFKTFVQDGSLLRPGARVLMFEGSLRTILTGERVALNFLSRLSGIATITRAFVRQASAHGVTILDTRKTTPTLRELEKYAVRMGGGRNHRLTLSDAVLIKDNHIAAAGSLGRAVALVRAGSRGRRIPVQVEAQNLPEVREALAARAEIVMLDNLPHGTLRKALRLMRGRAKTEISGGVNLSSVRRLARLGPDYISVGALTHSAPALDFSLELL